MHPAEPTIVVLAVIVIVVLTLVARFNGWI